MSDTETFSHAARLGGLRTEVINRFVATQAAVHLYGPPNNKRALNKCIGDFTTWLRKSGNDQADAELRRRVLLMVTEGRNGQGWADDEAASRILNLAEDMYCSIA